MTKQGDEPQYFDKTGKKINKKGNFGKTDAKTGSTSSNDNSIRETTKAEETDILSVLSPTVLSTRLLTENDLRVASKEELRILRNTIFAKHGRKFVSKDLQDYFGTKEWYHPQYKEVDHLLNNIEKKNIAFIQKHE
jgi:serine/threonine-protein kinase